GLAHNRPARPAAPPTRPAGPAPPPRPLAPPPAPPRRVPRAPGRAPLPPRPPPPPPPRADHRPHGPPPARPLPRPPPPPPPALHPDRDVAVRVRLQLIQRHRDSTLADAEQTADVHERVQPLIGRRARDARDLTDLLAPTRRQFPADELRRLLLADPGVFRRGA